MVAINGVLTHNRTITSNHFTNNLPTFFSKNLVIGLCQEKYPGTKTFNYQSEASVTNVNVFSVPMEKSKMIDSTSSGNFSDGDIVNWSKAIWGFNGSVKIGSKEYYKQVYFPNLFKMGDSVPSWKDCMKLCPRVKASGRVPLTKDINDVKQLAQQSGNPQTNDWAWAPFIYQPRGNFIDYYTGAPIEDNLWVSGQPNNGKSQPCTFWMAISSDGKIFDSSCTYLSPKMQCLCQFETTPMLKLRGLCHASKIENTYILRNINETIVFLGLTGTAIRFQGTSIIPKWTISVNLERTIATTAAVESSFLLGRQNWHIVSDSPECHEGQSYSTQLKMSGCNSDGEFTCDDGQCVTMEQRCDQVANCKDKSDEKRCQQLLTEEGYNRKVPPFTVTSINNTIVPVLINISIDLLKIVDMEETNHKIDFQFQITLEWRESDRVVFHNLKQDTSLNALSDDDIKKLWLPLVIYDNTDQKEVTRLGEFGNGEWATPVSVIREGSFTRIGPEAVDETEIFEGPQNTLSMQQVYTWQFQCKYDLLYYPFDTQVRQTNYHNNH